MFKKYAEVLGAVQLFVKPISRIHTGNIPLSFKRESARFKIKMQHILLPMSLYGVIDVNMSEHILRLHRNILKLAVR